jgi:hypothetical protein
MKLSEKSFGGWRRQRIFFKTLILMILLCKTIKISVLKKVFRRRGRRCDEAPKPRKTPPFSK